MDFLFIHITPICNYYIAIYTTLFFLLYKLNMPLLRWSTMNAIVLHERATNKI